MDDLLEDEDNRPFSPEEQEQIIEALNALRDEIRSSYELSGNELRLLEMKLDYVASATQRARRRDWLNIAYGAIASSFAGGLLTPEIIHRVLTGVATGVGPSVWSAIATTATRLKTRYSDGAGPWVTCAHMLDGYRIEIIQQG